MVIYQEILLIATEVVRDQGGKIYFLYKKVFEKSY